MSGLKAQKVEVKEQDFNTEISGNDLVYSMATKWAAARVVVAGGGLLG